MKTVGLYLHTPFCRSKCAYCDFFSSAADESEYERYTYELIEKISFWGEKVAEPVSSVYFGGGTPSVLGTARLCGVLEQAKRCFDILPTAEITLEANPESGVSLDFAKLRSAGFNRLSVGLQSTDETELRLLGRIHTPEQARLTVKYAQKEGFDNISLDLMMGIPLQTKDSLKRSIDFCAACGVKHISSYILKIEKGTRFYSQREKLQLPDEDEQAEFYLFAADHLERSGFRQYEISNFAVPSYESRHNSHYWRCGEYIGIGPSAHSFYRGRRFYYPRDFERFYKNDLIDDGEGGDEAETVMLALRLSEGLDLKEYEKKFGKPLSPLSMKKIARFTGLGYMKMNGNRVSFTPKGFLVSNSILSEII